MAQEAEQGDLAFSFEPGSLDAGSAAEKASFGRLSVIVNGCAMSEGIALGSNELQSGPNVAACHLAEWLVRNWWRLAFEPNRAETPDATSMGWDFAHWMSTIGEGYVWPNIELASDGLQVTVTSMPSEDPNARAFRYLGAKHEVVAVECLQAATHQFIGRVLDMLSQAAVAQTELRELWQTLQEEIARPDIAARRSIEALLGCDPQEANAATIRARLADARYLGRSAIAELAAAASAGGSDMAGAADVRRIARQSGFDARVADVIGPPDDDRIPRWGTCQAWRVGIATAKALRQRATLDGVPMDNRLLASMAGTSPAVIDRTDRVSGRISFAYDDESGSSRLAMRSRWETGRRFDLARLIADRLFAHSIGDPLLPATLSSTYRQKAQRAFAAELLAPIDAVDEFLGGEHTDDRLSEAAEYFNVSPLTISSILANNRRL